MDRKIKLREALRQFPVEELAKMAQGILDWADVPEGDRPKPLKLCEDDARVVPGAVQSRGKRQAWLAATALVASVLIAFAVYYRPAVLQAAITISFPHGIAQTNWTVKAVNMTDVSALAWSPDGTQICCGSSWGDLRVINAETLETEIYLVGHQDELKTIAWSSNGTTIASAGMDADIYWWDLGKRTTRRLSLHATRIEDVAFSSEGILAAMSMGGDVSLWDQNGELMHSFRAYNDAGSRVRWSPDGSRLVTIGGGKTATLRMWTPEGEHVADVSDDLATRDLAFSPDGTAFAAVGHARVGNNAKLRVWNTEDHRNHIDFDLSAKAESVAWKSDSSIVTVLQDGTASLWDVDNGSESALANLIAGGVSPHQWTHDVTHVAMAGDTLRVFDAELALLKQTMRQIVVAATDIEWHPSGDSFAVAYSDGLIRLFDLEGRHVSALEWSGDVASVSQLSWATDETGDAWLAVAYKGGPAIVWNPDGMPVPLLLPNGVDAEGEYRGDMFALWSPDGKWLATTHPDRRIAIWRAGNFATPHLIRWLDRERDADVYSFAWTPDSSTLVVGLAGLHGLRLWNIEQNEVIEIGRQIQGNQGPFLLRDHVHQVDVSPNGLLIAAGSSYGNVGLWNIDGTPIRGGVIDDGFENWAIAWSPTASVFAVGNRRGNIAFIDRTGSERTRFSGHRTSVQTLTWNTKQQTLASGDVGGLVLTCDETGVPGPILGKHIGPITGLAWNPQMTHLASISKGGMVRLWDMNRLRLESSSLVLPDGELVEFNSAGEVRTDSARALSDQYLYERTGQDGKARIMQHDDFQAGVAEAL